MSGFPTGNVTGTLNKGGRPRSILVRDLAWLIERTLPEPNSGCWLWTANISGAGYGKYKAERRSCLAHRTAYELVKGPIPTGLQIDHLCRVRCCINPDHLEAVTISVNQRRGLSPAKIREQHKAVAMRQRAKTHCPHGHEYTPENLITRTSPPYRRPSRMCRICENANQRLRHNEKRNRP